MWLLALFTGAVSLPVDHLSGVFWHSCGGNICFPAELYSTERWPLNPCCCIWSYWLCHYCETALEIFMYLLKTIIHWYAPKEAPQHVWIHIFRFGLITRRFVVYLGKVLVLDQTGSVGLVFGVVDGSDSHWTFLFHKYKCGKQKTENNKMHFCLWYNFFLEWEKNLLLFMMFHTFVLLL